jgi:hypothetical protein
VHPSNIPNFGKVTPLLWRGGQPGREGFEWLAKHKVDYVVKLCIDAEFSDAYEKRLCAGMTLITKFEMEPYTEDNPDYCADFQTIAAFIMAANDDGNRVFTHCHLGKDRTGGAIGMWRKLQGATMKEIRADWKIYGKPFNSYCDCLRGK